MPKLQKTLGCFEDAAQSHDVGGLEFRRCPRTMVEERELRVLGYFRDGLLDSLTPREVRRLPPKLIEGLHLLAGLVAKPAAVASE